MTQAPLQPTVMFVAPRVHSNYRGWIESLEADGWRQIFVVAKVGPSEDHTGIELHVVPRSRFSKICAKSGVFKGENDPAAAPSMRWLMTLLAQTRPDVAVIRGRRSLLSLLAAVCCRLLGIPAVLYVQDPLTSGLQVSILKRFVDRFLFETGISPIFGAGNHPLPNRWNFVAFEAPRARQVSVTSSSGTPQIVSIGKFDSSRKRHDLLIEALAELCPEDFFLTIIGSFPEGRVPQDLIEKLRSLDRNRVSIRTNLAHQQVLWQLSQADLFVLPASEEPASISVVEALGLGVPVICSDTCGTREYIPPGGGLVFRTDDAESLHRCIRKLLSKEKIAISVEQALLWKVRREAHIPMPQFLSQFRQNNPLMN